MGVAWAPFILITAMFGMIGGFLPKFIPPHWPNRELNKVVIVLIAVCCWLFWLCCYMSQMNPLIGPILKQRTLIAVKEFGSQF